MRAFEYLQQRPGASVHAPHRSPASTDPERAEKELERIDERIFAFAAKQRLAVRHSENGWPSRTLLWPGPIDRLIQIYAEDEPARTYTMWICAKKDVSSKRLVKCLSLREVVRMDDIDRDLEDLLDAGLRLLASWAERDLDFAIKLPPTT